MKSNFNEAYFGGLRTEIVEMVPLNCHSILDVGCGYGVLGRYLKENGANEVYGIELSANAAAEAGKVLDKVVVGNVESVQLPFVAGYFDCIICADVLEHLIDPWNVLNKLKQYLKPGGCIIASIPNIGFHRVVRKLMKGRWEYSESGVLDRTHLRFFTLDGILSLFIDNGMKIQQINRKIDSGLNMKLLNIILLNSIKESLVIQYIIKATL
jgi:2-polyprenyl-3-methyl-5-hydroxy-6-metoxy-1,4-benzoquinol methylase